MVAWFTVWRTTIPVGEVRYGCLVHRVEEDLNRPGEVRHGCLVHRVEDHNPSR